MSGKNQTLFHSSVLRGITELLNKRSTSAPPPGSYLTPEIYELKKSRREKKSDLRMGKNSKNHAVHALMIIFPVLIIVFWYQDMSLLFGNDGLTGSQYLERTPWQGAG